MAGDAPTPMTVCEWLECPRLVYEQGAEIECAMSLYFGMVCAWCRTHLICGETSRGWYSINFNGRVSLCSGCGLRYRALFNNPNAILWCERCNSLPSPRCELLVEHLSSFGSYVPPTKFRPPSPKKKAARRGLSVARAMTAPT